MTASGATIATATMAASHHSPVPASSSVRTTTGDVVEAVGDAGGDGDGVTDPDGDAVGVAELDADFVAVGVEPGLVAAVADVGTTAGADDDGDCGDRDVDGCPGEVGVGVAVGRGERVRIGSVGSSALRVTDAVGNAMDG